MPMHLRKRISVTVAFIAVIGPVHPVRADEQRLTVAAAISLKEALNDITETPGSSSAPQVRFNFGASGQLMAQIKQGAPVDVFISAADKQVDELISEDLADASSRVVIAGNTLVLITPADAADQTPTRFEDLSDDSIKRLAIGQPRVVPAGDYAAEVLNHLKLTAELKERIVYGAHVRQVLDYVERGEVSAGIVYNTDAIEAGNKVKVIATADNAWHSPIRYVAVVVSRSKHRDAAKTFLKELLEPTAQAKLVERGFAPATQPATQPASNQKPAR